MASITSRRRRFATEWPRQIAAFRLNQTQTEWKFLDCYHRHLYHIITHAESSMANMCRFMLLLNFAGFEMEVLSPLMAW